MSLKQLQLVKAGHAALQRVVALDHPFFLDRQPHRFHRRAIVVFTRQGGVQLARAGQESDLAMAQLVQVVHGRANARSVVQQDGPDLGIVRTKFSQHHGHIVVNQLIQHRLFLAKCQHGHAFNLSLQHAADARGQHSRIAIRRAHEDLVSVCDSNLFKALNQLRKKWVGNVLNNNAEDPAAP